MLFGQEDNSAHEIWDDKPLILELILDDLCDSARSGAKLSHAQLKFQS